MNGRQLRSLFQQFNRQYFGGRLPAYRVRVVRRITWLGESGRCLRKRKLIEIRGGQSDEQTVSTLLHEMAHAATSGHHETPWKREMIRLGEAGAPLSTPDATVRLEDWSGARVTRDHFRSVVQDLLIDLPGCPLPLAIRHFIRTEGGPSTISSFLKRYPWVRDVFRRLKREEAEERARMSKQLRLLALHRLPLSDRQT